MTVKAIRHHQAFAGRDADDAHAQYLLLTASVIDDWDAAFDHVGVEGNPHCTRLCELVNPKHAELTDRDAVDAHTQYLRLAETSLQTMAGSLKINGSSGLDLGANPLVAGSITGYCNQHLIIKPCDDKASNITLMGSCGNNDSVAGNVYLKTAYNTCFSKSGNMFLLPGVGGQLFLCSDTHVDIESDSQIDIVSHGCMCLLAIEMFARAGDVQIQSWGDICITALDDTIKLIAWDIDICADEMTLRADTCLHLCSDIISLDGHTYLNGDVSIDGCLSSCNVGMFPKLVLCSGDCSSLLRLHRPGNIGDVTVPMIDLLGCECDDFSVCTPIWDGVSTGQDHAKYCLCGGFFIRVNGTPRYIKFYEPLV